MTRGKHGVSAAAKKAVGERDQSIAAYQHHIRRLTSENAELRQKIDDLQDSHSKTVRVLKVERDEGLSPMLKVLQQENVKLKEKVEFLDERMRAIQTGWDNASTKVRIHFMQVHHLTGIEAAEVMLRLIGSEDLYKITDNPHLHKLNRQHPEAVERIQRARGERK